MKHFALFYSSLQLKELLFVRSLKVEQIAQRILLQMNMYLIHEIWITAVTTSSAKIGAKTVAYHSFQCKGFYF